jgi:hypothetical protein
MNGSFGFGRTLPRSMCRCLTEHLDNERPSTCAAIAALTRTSKLLPDTSREGCIFHHARRTIREDKFKRPTVARGPSRTQSTSSRIALGSWLGIPVAIQKKYVAKQQMSPAAWVAYPIASVLHGISGSAVWTDSEKPGRLAPCWNELLLLRRGTDARPTLWYRWKRDTATGLTLCTVPHSLCRSASFGFPAASSVRRQRFATFTIKAQSGTTLTTEKCFPVDTRILSK